MKIVTLDYKKCGANALALIRSIGPQNTMIVGTEKKVFATNVRFGGCF